MQESSAPGRPGDDVERRARYEALVLPELPVLLRVARTLTGQPADAEDLVQDTLLRVWRHLDGFDGAHPRAWLLTILRRTEINRNRRQRPQLLDDPDQLEVLDHRRLTVVQPSAEQQVIDRAFDAVVEAALLALPDPMRRAVLLVDVDGLSYAEAAAVLDIPEGTLTSRLHRGRKRIRDRLTKARLTQARPTPGIQP